MTEPQTVLDQGSPLRSGVAGMAARARALRLETIGLPVALVLLCGFLAITAPNFATVSNLFNILQSASFIGIVAFGMTLVIIAGEIDISVGSAVALGSAPSAFSP